MNKMFVYWYLPDTTHLHLPKKLKGPKTIQNVNKDVEHHTAVGAYIGTSTLQTCLTISTLSKHMHIYDRAIPFLGIKEGSAGVSQNHTQECP